MINDQIPEVMKSCVKKGGEERGGVTIEIGNMWWAAVNMMKRGTKIKKTNCENLDVCMKLCTVRNRSVLLMYIRVLYGHFRFILVLIVRKYGHINTRVKCN
jgi:hypothetical protein